MTRVAASWFFCFQNAFQVDKPTTMPMFLMYRANEMASVLVTTKAVATDVTTRTNNQC